jgi:uncharacterized DUF497 family protein
MDVRKAGFEWDRGNRSKCSKHGVTLSAVESIFNRPVTVFPDTGHSASEERFKAIGRTDAGRHILIVFTVRVRNDAPLIRPISARYMHQKEVAYYEKEAAKIAER